MSKELICFFTPLTEPVVNNPELALQRIEDGTEWEYEVE
jgi:hypothetical protein